MPTLAQTLDKERVRRDAHAFCFGAIKTKDEHDIDSPLKTFPDELCLRSNLDLFLVSGKILAPEAAGYALKAGVPPDFLEHIYNTGILFIEKSRHLMATWLACAYLLWRARRFPHQLLMVQSKREEDVAALVYDKEPGIGRISFLELSLEPYLQVCNFPKDGKWCHIYFPNGSHIYGIPQGGDIIRSHNPSVVFGDECCFQPEFGKAYTAALPAITHGGQLICVSSAEPSEFQTLVEAEI